MSVKWNGAVLSSWVWLISRSVMTSRFRACVRIAYLFNAWLMFHGVDGPHCLAYRCGLGHLPGLCTLRSLSSQCRPNPDLKVVLLLDVFKPVIKWNLHGLLLPRFDSKNRLFPVIYVLARNPGFTEVLRLCARKSRTFQAFPTRLVIIS